MAAAADSETADNLEFHAQISSGSSSGTPLDRTIDHIGLGRYQYTLLALCGLGWAADNMWLQAVAIALPRIQVSFAVSSASIGYLSSATFFGMMMGALLWGTLSDILGRISVFNLTLSLSALFGFLSFYVDTFPTLCLANFLLGTAVGGSMPTDGTFALETLPRRKRHLLTSLSVFFSFGSVIAAVVALFVIPGNSCAHAHLPTAPPCDIHKDNNGWKYLFFVLSVITVAMFLARFFFFSLHESPRYLVHAGKKEEAAIVLAKIARFNGDELSITVADVDDDHEEAGGDVGSSTIRRSIAIRDGEEERLLSSPVRERRPLQRVRAASQSSIASVKSSSAYMLARRWIVRPIHAWYVRVSGLLAGEWRTRTLLIWGIWMTMALAYTIFNVFLPTLLEYRSQPNTGSMDDDTSGLVGPLWEVVVFTLGGCPGALIGAYLVDIAPRYRWSKALVLAGATFATGACCFAFTLVSGYLYIVLTTVGMSLMSTIMWSILYGMTPELFVTEVRGTACGTASALSRIGGVLAPLIGGVLVSIDPSLVVLTSTAVFCVSTGLLILLHRNLQHSSGMTSPISDDD